jgi:4-amino-4-deoxy-L-arabinose transferase-like glycosyltransferase
MKDRIEIAVGGAPRTTELTESADAPAHVDAGAEPILAAITASPRIAWIAILATGVLIFIVNLGGYPLYTKGEPREAVTIFDIAHGGGIILPMRAGVEIPSKPLLMHWIAALFSVVAGGVSEWTVRLPSALFAIAGMIACFGYMRNLFDRRAAFIAAIILGTSFQYQQAGTGCRVDMTLTFFLEIAFFEFIAIAENLTARTSLLYLAIAAAVLTKGPIGAVLPAIAAAVWIVLWRRWDLFARLRLPRGVLIVGIIGGSWYFAAIAAGGWDFVHKQILAENLYRVFRHSGFHEGHAHPFYYEEGALIAGFLPWSPIAIAAIVQFLRGPRKIDARFGYLLVWFLTVLIIYNLPQSKRGVYLLALYPALSAMTALLVGDAIDSRESLAHEINWLSRAFGAVLAVTGVGAFAGLLMLLWWKAPLGLIFSRLDFRAPGLIPGLAATARRFVALSIALPVATGAIGIYLLRARSLAERMIAAIAGAAVCIALAVNLVIEPGIASALEIKNFAAQVIALAHGSTVGYFGNLDYGFAFYSGRNIDFVSPRDPNAPVLIVSPQDDWNLVGPSLRARFQIVLRSNPTNLDGSSPLLLLKRIDGPADAATGKSLSL